MARRAFVTGPNGDGMIDLNSLVDLPDGVVLTEAREINTAGQVIAHPASPRIPARKIYVIMVARLGLMALIARRKALAGPGTLQGLLDAPIPPAPSRPRPPASRPVVFNLPDARSTPYRSSASASPWSR
jgi:hypothetical protein